MLSQVAGEGVWISSIAAGQLKSRRRQLPAHAVGTSAAGGRQDRVRVKGIYRALAYESEKPLEQLLRRRSSPPTSTHRRRPGSLFTDRRASTTSAPARRHEVTSVYELPVDPKGLTLDGARALARRFTAVEEELGGSARRPRPEARLHARPAQRRSRPRVPGLELAPVGDHDRRLGRERGLARRAAAVGARDRDRVRGRRRGRRASRSGGAGSRRRSRSAAASTSRRSRPARARGAARDGRRRRRRASRSPTG